jgi:hypothetical protein
VKNTYSDNCRECGKKLWLCAHDAGKPQEMMRLCDKCLDKAYESVMIPPTPQEPTTKGEADE